MYRRKLERKKKRENEISEVAIQKFHLFLIEQLSKTST